MLDFIFTIDYEIYGNGQGSLKELVLDPMSKLMEIFQSHNKRLVVFAEVAEIEIIEQYKTDPGIDTVKEQLKELYRQGFEIGLHIHPQWYNAKYIDGNWDLEYSEYNLCTLPKDRIIQIIDQSIEYIQKILGDPGFIPISFRAGNWLLNPAQNVVHVLSQRGIKVDSSIFKGGLRHKHKLDYRRSLKNGFFWRFTDDANVPNANGLLLEIPIYTEMVPFSRILTKRRINAEGKASLVTGDARQRLYRFLDIVRFRHPLKLDFCRMPFKEMKIILDKVIGADHLSPRSLKPIVAIGHTKELFDFETVDNLLSYLNENNIGISTFEEVHDKCISTLR